MCLDHLDFNIIVIKTHRYQFMSVSNLIQFTAGRKLNKDDSKNRIILVNSMLMCDTKVVILVTL